MASETDVSTEVRIIYLYAADVVVGIEMAWVKSVERLDKLNKKSDKKGSVGSIKVEAGVAPVYDMAALLGSTAPKNDFDEENRRIVVIEGDKGAWGLLVDRVSQVTQLPADSLLSLPSMTVRDKSDFFDGVLMTGDELLLYLAPDKLRPDIKRKSKKKQKKNNANSDAPTLSQLRAEESKTNPLPSTRRRVSKDRRGANREEDENRRDVEYGQVVLFYFSDPKTSERPLVFGLSMTQIAEVLGEATILPVPGSESYVMGVANWFGSPIPMVSLSKMLGLEASIEQKHTRYIIARDRTGQKAGGVLGFPVWEEMRTVDLPMESEPSSEILQLNYKCIRGVVELKDETLVIPDIGQILFDAQLP